MKKKHTVFLDTSTIIGGGIDFLERTSKVANLFITDIVLQELDGLKNAEGDTGYKAREIYRQFAPATTKELYELPNRTELKRDDTLFEMTLPSGLVFYTIHRSRYKTRDINDSKIIEVANDYKGTLATTDIAQSVRAKSVGCDVWVVEKSRSNESPSSAIWNIIKLMVLSISFVSVGSLIIYNEQGFAVFLGYVFIVIGVLILIKGWNLPLSNPNILEQDNNSSSSSLNESSCVVTGTDFIGTSSSTYYND